MCVFSCLGATWLYHKLSAIPLFSTPRFPPSPAPDMLDEYTTLTHILVDVGKRADGPCHAHLGPGQRTLLDSAFVVDAAHTQ